MTDWSLQTTGELLDAYAGIMRALRSRGMIRSTNNPVADFAERLAGRAFDLTPCSSNNKSFDGTCPADKKWQVKGRRLTEENRNTGLSVIRNLDEERFDYVLAIYFNEDFSVQEAYRVEHAAVQEHAKYSKQQAGYVLSLKKALLADYRCMDVTVDVRRAERELRLVR